MLYLTSTEIISGVSGESEEKLRKLFLKAKVFYYLSRI